MARALVAAKETNMSRMGKLLLAVVLITGLFCAASCCPWSGKEVKGGKAGIRLCTQCGQEKGSDACCKPDAEKCGKCSLAKGSPGCCKIPKGATEPVVLCAKCNKIKGSDACCKPCAKRSAKSCGKCGRAKGCSGGCKSKKGK